MGSIMFFKKLCITFVPISPLKKDHHAEGVYDKKAINILKLQIFILPLQHQY